MQTLHPALGPPPSPISCTNLTPRSTAPPDTRAPFFESFFPPSNSCWAPALFLIEFTHTPAKRTTFFFLALVCRWCTSFVGRSRFFPGLIVQPSPSLMYFIKERKICNVPTLGLEILLRNSCNRCFFPEQILDPSTDYIFRSKLS